jgi:ATP-independent RNA helicase DbpA
LPALRSVLSGPHLPKQGNALVFCNFKASVVTVADDLNRHGFEADGLHGDLEQRDRNRVLAKFRNGSTRILVATDVAARGLDIAGIDLVVQYELPQKSDVYVHRIGRTGRAGATGVAIALVTAGDAERLKLGVAASGGELKIQSLPKAGQGPVEDTPTAAPTEALVTVLIRGGRRDKLRAGDIVGALTGEGGCTVEQVGRIEVQEDGVFVAVEKGCARRLLQAGRLRIKGRTFRVEGA